MVIPNNYINGIVVLPEFQILTTKHTPIQEPMFIDDYEATFQCEVYEDKAELQCLMKEVDNVLGVDLAQQLASSYIQLLKFGAFPGPFTGSTITLYFLKIINTITFKVRKDYEVRTLSFSKAFDEVLYPLTNGYYDSANIHPEYTSVAENVLQRIHSHGGIMKCIRDSS